MRNRFLSAVAVFVTLRAGSLWALPTLQLDIVDGVYDPLTQTTISSSPVFTVRALLKSATPTGTFFLSAAIEPLMSQSDPLSGIGSVVVDGTTYSSTTNSSAWNWGTPPLDVVDDGSGSGSGNIGPHGMFPTYYLEFEFNFSGAQQVAAYNTQTGETKPGSLYYRDFVVNVTGLVTPQVLHFDLYDIKLKQGDYVTGKFAPFSHDAESGHFVSVPDGGMVVLLLGLGLVGLAFVQRIFATPEGKPVEIRRRR